MESETDAAYEIKSVVMFYMDTNKIKFFLDAKYNHGNSKNSCITKQARRF